MIKETPIYDAKTAILDYIDDRLREWGAWALSGFRLGISYPPCSLEYRLMTEGHVERGYQGLVPMPEHAPAEEMEALLCEMGAQHHKLAHVIRIYYLEEGTMKTKARRIGIGHAQFETHLNTGRWWLAGRLSDHKEIRKLTQHFKT